RHEQRGQCRHQKAGTDQVRHRGPPFIQGNPKQCSIILIIMASLFDQMTLSDRMMLYCPAPEIRG
ncbi:hypothetical protein, partial [Acidiphilium sp.]|uniref:hypothetical protein n=1 Tax=Acidiphilium sp. TaxID=527 RepID=UPI00258FBD15